LVEIVPRIAHQGGVELHPVERDDRGAVRHEVADLLDQAVGVERDDEDQIARASRQIREASRRPAEPLLADLGNGLDIDVLDLDRRKIVACREPAEKTQRIVDRDRSRRLQQPDERARLRRGIGMGDGLEEAVAALERREGFDLERHAGRESRMGRAETGCREGKSVTWGVRRRTMPPSGKGEECICILTSECECILWSVSPEY
jgi:hypothetical protein